MAIPVSTLCMPSTLAPWNVLREYSKSGLLFVNHSEIRWNFRSAVLSSTSRSTGSYDVGARASAQQSSSEPRTCRSCKQPFDPSQNHPRACRFHTAHFGGETKRKFESVYTGGTLDTVGGGEIVQYWHCCGNKDPFDPGCEAAPHTTYDD